MNLMIEGSDKFEITPAISKQERSNKRFEFTPASCEAPQVLSVAQIETFNREGFIHGLQLFAPEAIAMASGANNCSPWMNPSRLNVSI